MDEAVEQGAQSPSTKVEDENQDKHQHCSDVKDNFSMLSGSTLVHETTANSDCSQMKLIEEEPYTTAGLPDLANSSGDDYLDLNELPVFANAHNKELFLKIKQVERKIKQTQSQTEENLARYQIMNDHSKNIKQDIDHTNQLIDARRKEIETETHLSSILERETGRLKDELRILQGAEVAVTEEISLIETKIHNASVEMESFKQKMSWNQDQLEQWIKTAAENENENAVLQKYSRIDEVKTKELHLEIERLTDLLVKKRASIRNIALEARTVQTELDRTSEIFQQAHSERRRLIQQWKDTICIIRERDTEINSAALAYADAKKMKDKKMSILQKKRDDLDLEHAQIDDETQTINDLERNLQSRRQEQLNEIQKYEEFCDELDSLQNELNSVTSTLHEQNVANKFLSNEIDKKEHYLKVVTTKLEKVKEQFKCERDDIEVKENKARGVERKVSERESELKGVEKIIQKLKNKLFHEQEALKTLTETRDNLSADFSSSQAQSKVLSARIRDLESEDIRHQGLEYNAKYQLYQMERKVARGLGERSDEEQKQLKQNIVRLESELDSYKSTQKMLVKQNRSLQQELRSWQRQRQIQQNQLEAIKQKIDDIELEISSCENSLKAQAIEKEDMLINHDSTRADMMCLRDTLTKHLNDVIALKHKRESIDADICHKKDELNVMCEVKTVELRAHEDDRHRNAIELAQRKVVADKLRSKYEVLTKSSGDNKDSNNSHIHRMILAAQKREELQREGDDLDRQIQVKEKEIFALEKTLIHLQEQNTKYRQSFAKVDKDNIEARKLDSLQTELREEKDQYIRRRFELRDLRDEYKRLLTELDNSNKEIEQHEIELSRLQLAFRQSCLDLEQSSAHFDVVQEELQRQVQLHREKEGISKGESSLEKMSSAEEKIRAPHVDQAVNCILEILSETVQQFPKLKDDYESALINLEVQDSQEVASEKSKYQ